MALMFMSEEQEIKWYVIHTYSGYENKVKANLEKAVENRGMQDVIPEISVPMEEHIEKKNGKLKRTLRKVFPGYVLVKMIMNDETWYVVRNTRGVTGFVGPASKPVPLTKEEIRSMGVEETTIVVDFKEKDSVKVINGPFENFMGTIEGFNLDKQKVKVLISMFGRETPVELDFSQIEKI